MAQKIGLVLSGGGGKGAYEVGVWRALNEFGIAQNISVISGTSVGALNAALFTSQNVPTVERVWNEIGPRDILYANDIENIFKKIIGTILPLLISPTKVTAITALLKEILLYGTFSRKGLSRIIDAYLDFDRIGNSGVNLYATCTQILPPSTKPKYLLLNDMSVEKANQVLLASSAIPIAFSKEVIDGTSYCDGGILDNTPVEPVYNEGCDIIIAVLLNRVDYIKTENYPNSTFMLIYPQLDPGGMINGVFNFSNPQEKIERGYEDALHVIGPVYETAAANFIIGKLLERIKLYDEDFHRYREEMGEYKSQAKQRKAERKKSQDNLNDAIGDLNTIIDGI